MDSPTAAGMLGGDRHLQRFLLRLRAVLARNLDLHDGAAKRPRAALRLPDTVFRIYARAEASGALERVYESTICPHTLNPMWMIMDLGQPMLESQWRHTQVFTVEVAEQSLAKAVTAPGPLHATATLTTPLPSAYAVQDEYGLAQRLGEDEAAAGTGRVRVEVDLRELFPVGCSIAELPSLPPNALLFSMRLDGARDARNRDTEALFAPRKLCAALKQFGLIEPPMDFRGTTVARAVLEDAEEEAGDNATDLGQLATELRERQAEVEELRALVTDKLGPNAHLDPSAQGLASQRLEALQAQVAATEAAVAQDEALYREEEAQLREEAVELATLMQSVQSEDEDLAILRYEATTAETSYIRTLFLLEARQTRLLAELQSIYPLQLLASHEWAIRGLELPRDLLHKDDEHVSSALGYAAHLVLMLSKYLGVCLRYQILYYSSRSAIRDEVRDGPNASANTYYLFRRGVERERFEAAVRMLERNVEQLLGARDVLFEPGLSMLGNLHNLFVHEMDPRLA